MTPSDRFTRLFDVFAEAGFVLYLVGGSVRDHLMGVPAGTDFDFATDAHPDQTEQILRAARFRTWNVGARFGTISTHCDGIPCEITTFRVGELYREGSRHPEVVFGTRIEDDLARRDLSVNAMAMDRDGRIVDPYDGAGAIVRRELEVPGGGLDNSISILRDDPLRLLRIARFAARLDFAPTVDCTAAATATAAELVHISRERWKMELDKLLVAPHAGSGLRWLHRTGALSIVLPPLADIDRFGSIEGLADRLAQLPRQLALRWSVVSLLCADAIALRDGAGLIAEVRTRYVAALASELRFSGDERAALLALVAMPVTPDSLAAPLTKPAIRRLCTSLGDLAEAALWIAWSQLPGEARASAKAALDERLAEVASLRASEDPVPRLPSGLGHALQKRYALPPGPGIRERIDRLRDAILDGALHNVPSIDDCLGWLDANG